MAVSVTTGGRVEARLGDLVEDALSFLYRAEERPLTLLVGGNDIDSAVDASFQLQDASKLNVTDLVESNHELMLVTKKTDAGDPTFTVIRDYAGTPNSGVTTQNQVLLKNPRWKRHDVWRSLIHGLSGTIGAALPMTREMLVTLEPGIHWFEVPSDALGVTRVAVGVDNPAESDIVRYRDVDDWEYKRDYPQSATGQAVEISTSIGDLYSDISLRYTVPYPTKAPSDTAWNETPLAHDGSSEDNLVQIWQGTEDIAALYAAAYRIMGREMSRMDVTAMESWNSDNAQRYNVNITAARFLWQSFYQRLDEAKTQHASGADKHRPFKRRINVGQLRRTGHGAW